MKKTIVFTSALLLSVLFIQCDNGKKPTPVPKNNTVLVSNNYSFENPPKFRNDIDLAFIDSETNEVIFQIETEVAGNDAERARGLMYRPDMEENQGMLFIFNNEQTQSFYMRNTIISLDIIYVNSDMEIVDIYAETNPLDDTSLPSAKPAQFVVEIKGGLCEKYGIEIGDLIVY